MPRATSVIHSHDPAADTVTLSYDDRFRRRMAMTTDGGEGFLLDLPETMELRAGDHLILDDGRHIAIRAADEPLMKTTSPDPHHLTRTAWHVGNRHLPCEVHADHLILRYDHVIEQMLQQLGCTVERLDGPFNPEGGAYGHGRTHGHAH